MNKQQTIHVGMINSYNILMGTVTIDAVVQSGLGLFAHVPDEEPTLDNIEHMIMYFQDQDMYEHCAELVKYIEENFEENGKLKGEECECRYPEIKEYKMKMRCAACNKRIRR